MCVVLLLGFAAAAFVGVGLGTILGGGDNGGAYLFLAALCVGIIIAINKFDDIKAKEEADFEAHKKSEWIRNHKKEIEEYKQAYKDIIEDIEARFPNRIEEKGKMFWYVGHGEEEIGYMYVEFGGYCNFNFEELAYEKRVYPARVIWSYKNSDVVFFQKVGDVQYISNVSGGEVKASGGGSSLAGAIVGGAIAGGVGAVIGSRKPVKIESNGVTTTVEEIDTRETVLRLKGEEKRFKGWEMYDMFMKVMPEKEYNYLQITGNQNK